MYENGKYVLEESLFESCNPGYDNDEYYLNEGYEQEDDIDYLKGE